MQAYTTELKYLKTSVTVNEYATGFTKYLDLDNAYVTEKPRYKKIYKYKVTKDAIGDCFEEATFSELESSIPVMATGEVKAEVLSAIIQDLIGRDTNFKQYVKEMYNKCPDNLAFGVFLTRNMASRFMNAAMDFVMNLAKYKAMFICLNYDTVYFSIPSDIVPELDNCERIV